MSNSATISYQVVNFPAHPLAEEPAITSTPNPVTHLKENQPHNPIPVTHEQHAESTIENHPESSVNYNPGGMDTDRSTFLFASEPGKKTTIPFGHTVMDDQGELYTKVHVQKKTLFHRVGDAEQGDAVLAEQSPEPQQQHQEEPQEMDVLPTEIVTPTVQHDIPSSSVQIP